MNHRNLSLGENATYLVRFYCLEKLNLKSYHTEKLTLSLQKNSLRKIKLVVCKEEMLLENWLGQTFSDIFNGGIKFEEKANYSKISSSRLKAEGEWFAAIAALQELLDPLNPDSSGGLILSGPTPIFTKEVVNNGFYTGIFQNKAYTTMALTPLKLLLPAFGAKPEKTCDHIFQVPLFPNDPIAKERFCLVLTSEFALVMIVGKDSHGLAAFQFSFDPEIVKQIWVILRSRLLLVNSYYLPKIEELVQKFSPEIPDYRLVSEFTRLLLKNLPVSGAKEVKKSCFAREKANPQNGTSKEVELLKALTHEIRTPLTTIRTLTRLLLKRTNLGQDIVKRLEAIDLECTEQINRMELIFKAAELESKPCKPVELTPTSLEDLFAQNIPRWKKQAQRRNVNLDVILPNKLPQVVSDPGMLEQMLTGLMEKFTRSPYCGGELQVRVTTAGDQLKLEFLSEAAQCSNPFQSLGQLLTFQPETGSLSLNLDVTKNLFHRLGGKLIVRQRQQQGEVLTVFLPLN